MVAKFECYLICQIIVLYMVKKQEIIELTQSTGKWNSTIKHLVFSLFGKRNFTEALEEMSEMQIDLLWTVVTTYKDNYQTRLEYRQKNTAFEKELALVKENIKRQGETIDSLNSLICALYRNGGY